MGEQRDKPGAVFGVLPQSWSVGSSPGARGMKGLFKNIKGTELNVILENLDQEKKKKK